MKALFCIIISLLLLGSMFIGCSDQIVNSNESSSSEGSLLLKKPNKPPKPPKTPSATPLPALNMNDQYIAGISDGKVYIWDGDNLTYMWSTSIDGANVIGIGNFIDDGNDDNKELLVARRIKVGKGKKNSVESEELLIFTEGDIEPSKTITLRIREDYTDALWDMKIANVDNDDDLEIILAFRDKLEIWEYDGTTISPTATVDFSSRLEFPWGIDVGDFNSDGVTNEIIVSFSGNFWRRYEYKDYSISEIEESTKYNEYGSLNCVKIADLDGNGDVEVLGGSSVGKILVWESSNQIIASDQVIPDYFAWAVDVGELDGNVDNGKEIIGVSSNSNRLHLFHYDDGTLIYEDKVITALSNSLNDVIISGEYPNNKIIVATSNGLEVFNNVYETFLVDDVGMLENLIFE